MKKRLLFFVLFTVCFSGEIPYPVYIVEMENSTKAVVPWNVKDTKKLTTKVKNPIPDAYLPIGKKGGLELDENLVKSLRDEGVKIGYISTGFLNDALRPMSNVKDVKKLVEALKTDTNFVNILPLDVSDKISKEIWNNDIATCICITNKNVESKEFRVIVRLIIPKEETQINELLGNFEIMYDEDDFNKQLPSIYATFEQVIELAKSPLVDFIYCYEPIMPV